MTEVTNKFLLKFHQKFYAINEIEFLKEKPWILFVMSVNKRCWMIEFCEATSWLWKREVNLDFNIKQWNMLRLLSTINLLVKHTTWWFDCVCISSFIHLESYFCLESNFDEVYCSVHECKWIQELSLYNEFLKIWLTQIYASNLYWIKFSC